MIDVPIQVKDALREGRLRKNYRFQVLNDDGTVDFTIDNNNLVSESVNIDERMCSGDEIKYGLCEGSSLEFQYFGKENITGRQLKVFVDVNCAEGDYINVGQFERMETITITDPGNYRVYSADENAYDYVWVNRGGTYTQYSPLSSDNGTEVVFYDLQVGDELEVEWSGHIYDTYLQKGEWYPIPMGYFTVKNCSRQASTGIIKVTAYNKLMSEYLDSNLLIDVDELIQEGTPGYPNEIPIDILLSKLLDGYSIAVNYQSIEVPIVNSPTITGGIGSFKYIWEEDGTRGYIHYKLNRYYFNVGVYNTPTETIYEIMVKFKKIVDYFHQKYTDFYDGNYYVDRDKEESFGEWVFTNESGTNGAPAISFSIEHKGQTSTTYTETISKNLFLAETEDVYHALITNLYHYNSQDARRFGNLSFLAPTVMAHTTTDQTPPEWTDEYLNTAFSETLSDLSELGLFDINEYTSEMGKYRLTTNNMSQINEISIRELQSAVFEADCQYGQLDRVTDLFSGVELNHSRLFPADTLYPDNALYPDGAQESAFRSQYSKLWADEGNVRKWRYLIITYKGLDENQQEKDFTLQRTVNADGTDDYNCSDNWLFRNLVWTATDIGSYADAMVLKMRDITWFPFEMWCAGLPYLETGDEIEIPLGEDTYTSYILQRQLKGIQNLQDTYINGTLDIF